APSLPTPLTAPPPLPPPPFPYTTLFRSPTRSSPTWSTSRPSRRTSTASPTPRAPPCCASWSPTSDGRSSSPACAPTSRSTPGGRSEEHTSELQSRENLVCRLLLEKKKFL